MTKTKFVTITDDWKLVKNACRTTVGKQFTENEPTDEFKRKILLSEHSPIRLLEFYWKWESIPYWVGMEWARHKFEKFISSQRTDRTNEPRDKKPQDAPINFDGYANMQNLIDAWRKRLCYQATKEARELAEDFKKELNKTNPIEASVLVPNCIYRGQCSEIMPCGYFEKFSKWVYDNYALEVGTLSIEERYKMYNKYFYREKNKR